MYCQPGNTVPDKGTNRLLEAYQPNLIINIRTSSTMKSIISKLTLLIFIALLGSSCKVLEEQLSNSPTTLYPYVEGQEAGFVNQDVEQFTRPKFQLQSGGDWPYTFSGGLAAGYQSRKGGYINKKGHFTTTPDYQRVHASSEGLALVRTERSPGFINNNRS